MLDRDKIRLMTELARFQQREGDRNLQITKQHRSDFIVAGLLKNLLATTFVYLLLWVALIAFDLNWLLENMHRIRYTVVLVEFILGYILFLLQYSIISYFVLAGRYDRARERVRRYHDGLELLAERWYGKEKAGKGEKL